MNGRQHLLIDADDTLWENNIYFEEAFDRFCDLLDHSRLTPDEVRAALDEIEIANSKVHGYGSHNFVRNLRQCFEKLVERDPHPDHLEQIASYAHDIMSRDIELMPGVAETIPVLSQRHELTLFTKGSHEEQRSKLERSGLQRWFHHCEIVKEKDRHAYEQLLHLREFDSSRTWMIGNSPKSDINPALAAGLQAVFVPHERTWGLEHEEIVASDRLYIVKSFADLTQIFVAD